MGSFEIFQINQNAAIRKKDEPDWITWNAEFSTGLFLFDIQHHFEKIAKTAIFDRAVVTAYAFGGQSFQIMGK